ncbi:uncharacterized protein LOC126576865 [Anopheles aquasalis]|uniref:uncharacterized protein LOC126576865 n=1 Tax=Anopheles aquasalis TaxID=42839 RepID=UPI00215B5E4E|nr:uncharacterized protein LOC126576865 [Anopheles aquasalis]
MFKVLCLFAIIAVVAAGVSDPRISGLHPAPGPLGRIVKREAVESKDAPESALEEQDDMDKAETFGFGYHKSIHVYPSYGYGYGYGYPFYGHGYGYGYGYPGYGHGYYGGYY